MYNFMQLAVEQYCVF